MPFYITGAVYIIGGVLTLAIDPKLSPTFPHG